MAISKPLGKMPKSVVLGKTRPDDNAAILPRRPYGKTGAELSVIGLGGIVLMNTEQEHANQVVAKAFALGVNYFDVAPTYGDAELRLGPALEPYRKQVFLACKTTERLRQGVEKEMRQSLERLMTDYFDLYQLHALTDIAKDVDTAFGKNGAMEAMVEARKAGTVRHLGFSAHSVEAALAAMERFDFDSVLFPINAVCYYSGNFGKQVIEKAQSRNMAILALKSLAKQPWPTSDHPLIKQYPKCWYEPLCQPQDVKMGLRFTLSEPVTAAIPPGSEKLFWLTVETAMDFKPLRSSERRAIKHWAGQFKPLFSYQQEDKK